MPKIRPATNHNTRGLTPGVRINHLNAPGICHGTYWWCAISTLRNLCVPLRLCGYFFTRYLPQRRRDYAEKIQFRSPPTYSNYHKANGFEYYDRAVAPVARTVTASPEALSALTKSVELDPDQVEYMVEEADLKALAMPGFKKLIPEPAKQ